MSDVNEKRRELGEKAAKKGEPLHASASPEYKEAYRRSSIGFGSNVTPKHFGKDSTTEIVWYCVCGFPNKSTRVAKKAGEIVCWHCGIQKAYGEDHERDT